MSPVVHGPGWRPEKGKEIVKPVTVAGTDKSTNSKCKNGLGSYHISIDIHRQEEVVFSKGFVSANRAGSISDKPSYEIGPGLGSGMSGPGSIQGKWQRKGINWSRKEKLGLHGEESGKSCGKRKIDMVAKSGISRGKKMRSLSISIDLEVGNSGEKVNTVLINNQEVNGIDYVIEVTNKLVVNCNGNSGDLCLFWAATVQVMLLSYSMEHIDVHMISPTNRWWRLTGFYGNPDAN
ncbi:hypothetical protein Q3G72_003332 [Acer saccharum]|nr:hypothetical protein Q3G72_003332 [Acer saccharum]